MSNRDALAKLIGETLGADESAGCDGGYVDDSSLGSTVLDGRFDLNALAEHVIAAGWYPLGAEKMDDALVDARRQIAWLRETLEHIAKVSAPNSHVEFVARRALEK